MTGATQNTTALLHITTACWFRESVCERTGKVPRLVGRISAGLNSKAGQLLPGVEHFVGKRIRYHGAGRTDITIKRCAIMKRRNADCGKIRRPIKKNKIAEQIGRYVRVRGAGIVIVLPREAMAFV